MRESKATQDGTIRRYLLGELAGEELRRVDERLMSDDDFFREVLDAEGELVDEYERGSLTARERERFETYFLVAAERRDDVRFAAALRSHATAHAPAPRAVERGAWLGPLFRTLRARRSVAALASALLFVAVVGLWLITHRAGRTLTPPGESARQAASPAAAAGPREVAQSSEAERPGPPHAASDTKANVGVSPTPGQRVGESVRPVPPPRIIVLTLTPGLTRAGGEIERVVIPGDARATVRLRLKLAENLYESYSAEVLTAEGAHVHTLRRLRARRTPSGDDVLADLPTALLTRGADYQVRLSGLSDGGAAEAVGRYYFRASKD